MTNSILYQLTSMFPSGWSFTALIYDFNHEVWQATAWSDDLTHAVMQQGDTLDQALASAIEAIYRQDYWAPNATRIRLAEAASDLLSIIGLTPKAPASPVKRRTIPNG